MALPHMLSFPSTIASSSTTTITAPANTASNIAANTAVGASTTRTITLENTTPPALSSSSTQQSLSKPPGNVIKTAYVEDGPPSILVSSPQQQLPCEVPLDDNVKTAYAGDGMCTPTKKARMLPPVCPMPPRKRRPFLRLKHNSGITSNTTTTRTPPGGFFCPPDLELFFSSFNPKS